MVTTTRYAGKLSASSVTTSSGGHGTGSSDGGGLSGHPVGASPSLAEEARLSSAVASCSIGSATSVREGHESKLCCRRQCILRSIGVEASELSVLAGGGRRVLSTGGSCNVVHAVRHKLV